MKVLLIQPPPAKANAVDYMSLQYPINLGYIASSLNQDGHIVKMLDFNVQEIRFLDDTIMKFSPEIIGVTSMTSTIYNAKDIISRVKHLNSKIVTVVGGVHATALPRETLELIDDLDIIVVGEGEVTIKELGNAVAQKRDLSEIMGIWYKNKNGEIQENPKRSLILDLDLIPFPNRELLPLSLYAKAHVSRGFSRSILTLLS